jgi:PAS domain S-box-containing protein
MVIADFSIGLYLLPFLLIAGGLLVYRISLLKKINRHTAERLKNLEDEQEVLLRKLEEKNKLEKELQRLALVASRSANYVIIADKEDRIEWVNEAFTRITGYTPDKVIGRKNAELMLSNFTNYKIRNEVFQTVIKNHGNYQGEICNYTEDGRFIWLSMDITPILNESGGIFQFVISGSDITRRKANDEQLKISERILDQINAIVLVADREGRISYVNPATKSILGFDPSELQGDGWWKHTAKSPAEQESKKKMVSDAIRGKVELPSAPYENSINNKDGQVRWIRWSDSRDDAGFAVGIGLDITERIEAEAKLKHYSRELLLLNDIGKSILSSRSLQDTINDVLRKIKDNFSQSVRVSIAMFDFEAGTANFNFVWSENLGNLEVNSSLPLKEFRSLETLQRNQAFISNNITALADPSETDEMNIASGVNSYIAMPLFHESGLIGSINLESEAISGFSTDDVQLLQTISSEIAIALQQAELKQALQEKNILLEERNEDINASLRYAKRLQEAILPPNDYVKYLLPESFILYQPKDIISGDFYWLEKDSDVILIAAADCTGHGTPGAFMSIVGNNLLSQAVNIYHITQPSLILDFINNGLSKVLHNKLDEVSIKDGMDIVLCSLDLRKNILEFSGANNALWLIRNKELHITKGDKFPVGAYLERGSRLFTNHIIELQAGDTIYIFSDGFADQFGLSSQDWHKREGQKLGASLPKGKKFKYNQLRELLLSIQQESMESQKLLLNKAFLEWKGELEQVDDILVIGIKI